MVDLDLPSREDLRDMSIFGSLSASIADVLMFGGDTVLAIAFLFVDQIELFLAVAAQLVRLSGHVDAIPEGPAKAVLILVGGLFVVITAVRLVRRARDRVSSN